MTTRLADLFDPKLLRRMIGQGFVSKRLHNEYDYAILNYTPKAATTGEWNEVTLQCRGLIYRTSDDVVIARPFKKFFNYGQAGADEIDLHEPADVTDKMDGSLGIIYFTPDGEPAVATRGSFHSEQAEWATAWLREHTDYPTEAYAPTRELYTDLVEIVYPENRIVVDYGERAELIYLGTIQIAKGEFCRSFLVPLTYAGGYGRTLGEALALKPRKNAEGVVVMTKDGRAVKLKQEDYLAMHRARFNLTPWRIWKALTSDVFLEDFLAGLPDEFHEAAEEKWREIEAAGMAHVLQANACASTVPDAERKEQAAYIHDTFPHLAAEVFAILDQDYDKIVKLCVKACEPKGPGARRVIA